MTIVRPTHQRLFAVFNRAHGKLARRATAALKTAGIQPAQAMALVYLGYHNGCQLSELADGIGINNAAVSGLSERMEKAGFVTRKAMQSDGRGKTVHLSGEGLLMREQVMDAFRTIDERLTKGFSEREIETILTFLARASELEAE